jgi:cytochrome P450
VTVGAVEFDPFDYEFHRDPYPTYQWLRDDAPVYHNEGLDFWALSRFDDVLAGLHDPVTFTSTGGVAIEHTDASLKSMIEMDPPQHTQMRKLIARRFTPRRVAELEPRVREWTNTLLDALGRRPQFDVVEQFTALLPTTVVGTMLGIPPDRHDDARQWTDDLLTREPGNPVPPRAAAEGAINIALLAQELSAARRERPADDILSVLVDATVDGVPLTDEQVIGFCLLLIGVLGEQHDFHCSAVRHPHPDLGLAVSDEVQRRTSRHWGRESEAPGLRARRFRVLGQR